MTTLKRNWGIIGILFIAALLFMPATQAGAETVKCRVVTYLAKVGWSPVGDAKGHIVGFYERRGLAFFENGEVATFSNRGSFESIKGKSSYQGYNLYTYEDGSTTIGRVQGTMTPIEGTKQRSVEGTQEYIMGTGRFEGIKGSGTHTGKQVVPYSEEEGIRGDAYYDVTNTYTLPSK